MAYTGTARVLSGGGSSIADTDALPEGTANQYYTEARVTANPTVAGNTTAAAAANALAVTANAGVATNDGRLDTIEANGWVKTNRITNQAVTAAKIAAGVIPTDFVSKANGGVFDDSVDFTRTTGANFLDVTGNGLGSLRLADSAGAANEKTFRVDSDGGLFIIGSQTDAGVLTALLRSRSGQGISVGNPASGIPATRGFLNVSEIMREGVVAGLNMFAVSERPVSGGTATTATPFALTNVQVNANAVLLRLTNLGGTDRFEISDTTNGDYDVRVTLDQFENTVVIAPKTKGNTTLNYRRFNDAPGSNIVIDILGYMG